MSGGGNSWCSGDSVGGGGGPGIDRVPGLSSSEKRAEYEAEINTYLEDSVREYSQRDTEKIGIHLETLRQALGNDTEFPVELRFGGSIKKHTYIDGLSDVDAIATTKGDEIESKSPREAIHDFALKVKARLPLTEVSEGDMAVTVSFSDGTDIQILPAIKTARGLRVASRKGEKWSNVSNPDRFARRLSSINKETGGKVVKVIRLYKAGVNSQLSEDAQLSGYHIEALATEAFSNYQGRRTYKDMLIHLTKFAADHVQAPITDSTGQSDYADNYLGEKNDPRRKIVRAALERQLAKMNDAESEASVRRWKPLMED
jgi:hypothetical protein